jgi:HEPN domain-containing protein
LDIAFDGHIIYDDGFIAELMTRTREDVKKKGIKRTETGGWRFPVKFRESTPLSKLENREWADIWLNDAKRDLDAAIKLFEDGIFDKCVTHSQQAVEKGVKSILICFGIYERTHYVSGILAKELKRQGLGQWSNRLGQIADYARDLELDATLSRYPGMFKGRVWIPYREYDEAKAKEALQKARFALDSSRAFIAWWFGNSEATERG